jgi:phytoene synthase
MIGPDEQLALAYTPTRLRPGFEALLAFDATLANAFKVSGEAALIQIRLAWWREELGSAAPRDPVLVAVNALISDNRLTTGHLLRIIDGWEMLLADPLHGDAALDDYARDRGGGLFAAAARLAECDVVTAPGEGWALADFARHCSHGETAARAMQSARARFADAAASKIAVPLRPFALLARFARADCRRRLDRQTRAGSPRRALQAIGFIMSGG